VHPVVRGVWAELCNLEEMMQDHRAVKRITKPMPGFKSFRSAGKVLAGIELMHMIRKGQMTITEGVKRSFAEQFYALADVCVQRHCLPGKPAQNPAAFS